MQQKIDFGVVGVFLDITFKPDVKLKKQRSTKASFHYIDQVQQIFDVIEHNGIIESAKSLPEKERTGLGFYEIYYHPT